MELGKEPLPYSWWGWFLRQPVSQPRRACPATFARRIVRGPEIRTLSMDNLLRAPDDSLIYIDSRALF